MVGLAWRLESRNSLPVNLHFLVLDVPQGIIGL